MRTHSEKGFTLIELLTVVAIMGILAGMSMQAFRVLKANAALSSTQSAVKNARIAVEASTVQEGQVFNFINFRSQDAAGAMAHADMAKLLEGYVNSPNVRISVYHDPHCVGRWCTSVYLEARHCTAGMEFSSYQRFGDGLEVFIPRIPGVGCP